MTTNARSQQMGNGWNGYFDPSEHHLVSKERTLPPSVLRMFPIAFMLFCVAMFVMPIYLILYVGEDPTTRQWFPHITRIVMVLPIVYLITLLVHICKGGPSRIFITISLVGSCLMLLIVSNFILMEAYEMAPMFAAESDCMSWEPKRELEGEWKLARAYYATCANDMAKTHNTTFAAAVSQYRIQDCPNYGKAAELHPAWAYLEHLEVTQWCSGWCKSAQALWTKERVQDACSPVVAQILHDTVIWDMTQVCFYAVFSLVVIAAVLLSIPRVLRDYGMDWQQMT